MHWITTRELARTSRAVLDELERTGVGVMVSRHGRPVALIAPVGEVARRTEALQS